MTDQILSRATSVSDHSHHPAKDSVVLAYEDRHRRRMTMTCEGGFRFLLDLPQATTLQAGDHLILTTGETIAVKAAAEPLMIATCQDTHHLIRTAWHVGNRHLPAQILPDRLVLRWDHVIAEMLEVLGCDVTRKDGPFTPEGGAYDHGRTHGHEH